MRSETEQQTWRDRSHPVRGGLTVRALVGGAAIGALLSLCTVYTGLRLGFGLNVSLTATLASYGLWQSLSGLALARGPELRENVVSQTTASAAAAISSAGLVSAIPAWSLLTGQQLSYGALVGWIFSVALVGIVVAIGLRRQLLERERLTFPMGLATAELVGELHQSGAAATDRVQLLVTGAGFAGGVKLVVETLRLGVVLLPLRLSPRVTLANLGLGLEPSALLFAAGALMGTRGSYSLAVGVVGAWCIAAPLLLQYGVVHPDDPTAAGAWYAELAEWLVWPGVSLMLSSAVASFVVGRLVPRRGRSAPDGLTMVVPAVRVQRRRGRSYWTLFAVAVGALSVLAQWLVFRIRPEVAIAAVLGTYVLSIVAARVNGEVGITPVGAMGKVTQLTSGLLVPGDVTTNLMTANVTGGAASQCAEMMNDFKVGAIHRVEPFVQVLAQVVGVAVGAFSGAGAYVLLVRDPARQLLGSELPAPAVMKWKAVAELLATGWDRLPPGVLAAALAAAVLAVLLTVVERALPAGAARYVPSPAAVGLAVVLPASSSLTMVLGGLSTALLLRAFASFDRSRAVSLASGLVAGESLVGVALALARLLTG